MNPHQPTPSEAAVADIEYILSECGRYLALIQTVGLKESLKEGGVWSGSLSLPNGGAIPCGADALRRLYALAVRALRHSDAAGTVEPEKVFKALRCLVVQRFIVEQLPPGLAQVDAMLAEAIMEAGTTRFDRTHFIPCRLMYANDPETFKIGPVTFYTTNAFNERMRARYERYIECNMSPPQRQLAEQLLKDARHYYDGFGWVGEVKVMGCDPETSRQRAQLAVTASLDILHLLFGAQHTDRMAVGGPRLADDCRAHFHLDHDGVFDVTCSRNSTSAVAIRDGWAQFFRRDDVAFLLRAANTAIEPLINPAIDRPLATRFIDAAAWFGEAVREQSDGARIIKAANALERVLLTSEHRGDRGVTSALSERAAAVCYDPQAGEPFAAIVRDFRKLYDLRSGLVHGSLSPFDPEVKERCSISMRLTEKALCGALALFASREMFDRLHTDSEFAAEFERLVVWAKKTDVASRAASA